MEEEIGKTAGAIWQALSTQGGLSLTRLKNQVKARAPVFDWAIRWLAREDQIVIPAEKRFFRQRSRRTCACFQVWTILFARRTGLLMPALYLPDATALEPTGLVSSQKL